MYAVTNFGPAVSGQTQQKTTAARDATLRTVRKKTMCEQRQRVPKKVRRVQKGFINNAFTLSL